MLMLQACPADCLMLALCKWRGLGQLLSVGLSHAAVCLVCVCVCVICFFKLKVLSDDRLGPVVLSCTHRYNFYYSFILRLQMLFYSYQGSNVIFSVI